MCVPNHGEFEQLTRGIVNTCEGCGRRGGDDFGNVVIRNFRSDPRKAGEADATTAHAINAVFEESRRRWGR